MAGWKGVTLKYKGATTSYGITVFDPIKDYYITYNTQVWNKYKEVGSYEAEPLNSGRKWLNGVVANISTRYLNHLEEKVVKKHII